MNSVYTPSRTLASRIKRRLTPYAARQSVRVNLNRPIVSFSFDDCPLSVVQNGLPLIEKQGWQSTFYMASGLYGITNHLGLHMQGHDVQAVAASGHEIGGHTFSHLDATAVPLDVFLSDIDRNQAELDALNVPRWESFAYPYGQTYPALKRELQVRFAGSRGITPIAHSDHVDLNQIGSAPLFADRTCDNLIQIIGGLSTRPAWLTIFTHDICDTPSAWGCTAEHLQRVIDAVLRSGADVMPVNRAIQIIKEKS